MDYVIVSSDGRKVIFDKKEIKLFPSIINKFSSESTEITLNYSYDIIQAIKDYCVFCKKNGKVQGMFDKIEVMCGKTGNYKKIYNWAINWISYDQIEEMNEFIKEHRSEDIEAILGLHLAEMIEKYQPEEIASMLNENYDDDEDYQNMIQGEIDWIDFI